VEIKLPHANVGTRQPELIQQYGTAPYRPSSLWAKYGRTQISQMTGQYIGLSRVDIYPYWITHTMQHQVAAQ
jgi:hypothetical protein